MTPSASSPRATAARLVPKLREEAGWYGAESPAGLLGKDEATARYLTEAADLIESLLRTRRRKMALTCGQGWHLFGRDYCFGVPIGRPYCQRCGGERS